MPNIIIDPYEPLVEKAIRLFEQKYLPSMGGPEQNTYSKVKTIKVEPGAPDHVGQVRSNTPDIIYLSVPKIKSLVGANETEVINQIVITLAHELGHLTSNFQGGEGPAEAEESKVRNRMVATNIQASIYKRSENKDQEEESAISIIADIIGSAKNIETEIGMLLNEAHSQKQFAEKLPVSGGTYMASLWAQLEKYYIAVDKVVENLNGFDKYLKNPKANHKSIIDTLQKYLKNLEKEFSKTLDPANVGQLPSVDNLSKEFSPDHKLNISFDKLKENLNIFIMTLGRSVSALGSTENKLKNVPEIIDPRVEEVISKIRSSSGTYIKIKKAMGSIAEAVSRLTDSDEDQNKKKKLLEKNDELRTAGQAHNLELEELYKEYQELTGKEYNKPTFDTAVEVNRGITSDQAKLFQPPVPELESKQSIPKSIEEIKNEKKRRERQSSNFIGQDELFSRIEKVKESIAKLEEMEATAKAQGADTSHPEAYNKIKDMLDKRRNILNDLETDYNRLNEKALREIEKLNKSSNDIRKQLENEKKKSSVARNKVKKAKDIVSAVEQMGTAAKPGVMEQAQKIAEENEMTAQEADKKIAELEEVLAKLEAEKTVNKSNKKEEDDPEAQYEKENKGLSDLDKEKSETVSADTPTEGELDTPEGRMAFTIFKALKQGAHSTAADEKAAAKHMKKLIDIKTRDPMSGRKGPAGESKSKDFAVEMDRLQKVRNRLESRGDTKRQAAVDKSIDYIKGLVVGQEPAAPDFLGIDLGFDGEYEEDGNALLARLLKIKAKLLKQYLEDGARDYDAWAKPTYELRKLKEEQRKFLQGLPIDQQRMLNYLPLADRKEFIEERKKLNEEIKAKRFSGAPEEELRELMKQRDTKAQQFFHRDLNKTVADKEDEVKALAGKRVSYDTAISSGSDLVNFLFHKIDYRPGFKNPNEKATTTRQELADERKKSGIDAPTSYDWSEMDKLKDRSTPATDQVDKSPTAIEYSENKGDYIPVGKEEAKELVERRRLPVKPGLGERSTLEITEKEREELQRTRTERKKRLDERKEAHEKYLKGKRTHLKRQLDTVAKKGIISADQSEELFNSIWEEANKINKQTFKNIQDLSKESPAKERPQESDLNAIHTLLIFQGFATAIDKHVNLGPPKEKAIIFEKIKDYLADEISKYEFPTSEKKQETTRKALVAYALYLKNEAIPASPLSLQAILQELFNTVYLRIQAIADVDKEKGKRYRSTPQFDTEKVEKQMIKNRQNSDDSAGRELTDKDILGEE